MKLRQGQMTNRQKLFCEVYIGAGKHCAALSARLAGYAPGCSHVTGCQLLKKPKIAARIAELEVAASRTIRLDRQRVLSEMLDAGQMARDQSEPGAMIRAWRHVALMCGFYRPEAPQPVVPSPREVALMAKFEAMSIDELNAFVAQS